MLNETIIETLDAITPAGTIWPIKLLAIFGLIFIMQTLLKTGVDLAYVVAYIIGAVKWISEKIRRKNEPCK